MPTTVRHGLAWRFQLLASHARIALAHAELASRRLVMGKPLPHGLPFELVVSVTSYPARFGILAKTLRSLLRQSVRADRVILWIAHEDIALLPPEVRALAGAGLTIAATEDIRSYKKIVPALREFPGAAIVTADDDLYYRPHWLADLVEAWHADPASLPCHRAHQVRFAASGRPRPYAEWELDIAARGANPMVFPTSGSGVLYPPGSLHPETGRDDLFKALAPLADDIWLYCMARLNGRSFRKVGPQRKLVTWETSQGEALSHFNLTEGGNDQQLANVLGHYGAAIALHGAAGRTPA